MSDLVPANDAEVRAAMLQDNAIVYLDDAETADLLQCYFLRLWWGAAEVVL
jgi:hypothetical protein